MNTGLDCDLLGGVGQGSGTVNNVRTHAGMYTRTRAAAPHVICFTLATVLVDDAAMRAVWGIQTQRSVDCAKPKVVGGTGIPDLWSQIINHKNLKLNEWRQWRCTSLCRWSRRRTQ